MKPTAQQPRFYKFRKYQIPQYIKDALDALKPPDDITVSQWAEQYRQLSRKESNLQGAWRNSVTPYLVGIMDEFNNWETERIVVVKPTQVGGTEVELNALGYLIDQDPAPTLIVYPNDEIAESTSANRIMSMLESPRLKRHFLKNASSKKELQFTTDMYIALTGAGSAADLSSKPIRYLFLDEVDKFKAATTQEADPISLSIERTKSYFSNRKIYICSTPTLKYTVSLTYYINQSDNNRAAAIQQAVSAAVDSYIAWQRKIGRDINPSKLLALVMGAGVKRAQITAPIFTAIPADSIAAIDGTASITYGGLEDD